MTDAAKFADQKLMDLIASLDAPEPHPTVIEEEAGGGPYVDLDDVIEKADALSPESGVAASAVIAAAKVGTDTHDGEHAPEAIVTASTKTANIDSQEHPMTEAEKDAKKMAMVDAMIASLGFPCERSDGTDPVADEDVVYLDVSEKTDTTDRTGTVDIAEPIESALCPPREAVPTIDVEAESVALVDAMAEDMPERTEDGRLVIQYRLGHLQEFVRAAEQCLASTSRHFQREGAVVTVYTDPATGESVVQDLQPLGLVHALDGVSAWMRLDKRSNCWVQIDPPDRICNVIVKAGHFEHLPVLNGLARQPFLRPDGSVCLSPGYDAATGLYGVFQAEEFDVPAKPTREQAQQAVAVLDDLLAEFAFAAASDRSAALSAMLTAAVRTSLPLAPMFHVRAPQISSGKSCLCELITALATPQQGTPVGFPVRDEECTKLLTAQLVRAPAVIEFDNLTGDLKPFKSLCTALTSERMEGRILGRSKMVTVNTRTLFLSSGNNVGPVADMTRRVVTINLDPGCENPAMRDFDRPNLIADVRRERGRYVAAALTVVQAWIVAGKPEARCPPLASYGAWSDLCRQPLLWLGQPDPAAAVFVGLAEDPEREVLGRLLQGWHDLFGSSAVMVRDVVARAATGRPGAAELMEALLDLSDSHDRINHRKLGHAIKRYAGRLVNGLRLAKAPKTRNVVSWRVESVVPVESVLVVCSAPTGEDGHTMAPQ